MKHIKYGNTELSRKGDFAEYYAVTWLWDNGYEVFRNCGCTGGVDLIAISKTGELTLIDVKSYRSKKGKAYTAFKPTGKRTDQQKKLGVRQLYYDAETRKLRFVNHRT